MGKGINNATKLVPSLCPLLFWIHIQQDLKHWVQNHHGTSDDILVYIDHVLQFLESGNSDEFEENYVALSSKGSKSFLKYFQTLKDEIMKCVARYNIEPWNI